MFSFKSKKVRELEAAVDRLIISTDNMRQARDKMGADAAFWEAETKKLSARALELEKNLAAKNDKVSQLDQSLSSRWDHIYRLEDTIKELEAEVKRLEGELEFERKLSAERLKLIQEDQKRIDELKAVMKTWKHKAEIWKDAVDKASQAFTAARHQDFREHLDSVDTRNLDAFLKEISNPQPSESDA